MNDTPIPSVPKLEGLNQYQEVARSTAFYEDAAYPFLGLCGEAGECAEKMKKILRDKDGIPSEEDRAAMKLELGDVLWYLANIAADFKIPLSEVAQGNAEKLASRKARGKLGGSGDNR